MKKVRLVFLGAAFMASIAYVDPGNFATNISAGSLYGYKLLWVVVASNFIGMFVQWLSAKLGIVTDKSLAVHIREQDGAKVAIFYWVQAEIIAIATDLAEFIGAALGFHIIFGLSMLAGALITAALTTLILYVQKYRFKAPEVVISLLLFFVAGCYVFELFRARPDWSAVAFHSVVPQVNGVKGLVLASGILGATVMPHVIYLHSSLTSREDKMKKANRSQIFKGLVAILIAMAIAGFVNMAMVITAAETFHSRNISVVTIEKAYKTLSPILGNAASFVFGLSLIFAGLASTVIGTMAGETIMRDFIHKRIHLWLRRLVTIAPSIVIIALKVDTTKVLVLSQVFLSFGIAFALYPLLRLTGSEKIMGPLKNRVLTRLVGWVIFALVVSLNIFLLLVSF